MLEFANHTGVVRMQFKKSPSSLSTVYWHEVSWYVWFKESLRTAPTAPPVKLPHRRPLVSPAETALWKRLDLEAKWLNGSYRPLQGENWIYSMAAKEGDGK